MAAVQLSFSLRTSPHCKTVHLLGSWDTYKNNLPLSKDSSKSGGWKGTFKFQGASLKPGQRYWYYYIIDGYQVSHDPSRESTTEPTTGRQLNILDIPGKGLPTPKLDIARATATTKRDSRQSTKRNSGSPKIPCGRSLDPSEIKSPRPVKPNAVRYVTGTDFSEHESVEQLARQFSSSRISYSSDDSSSDIASDNSSDIDSDVASDVPSLSSNSSGSSNSSARSSPSSCSSRSSNSCTCQRYGVTRKGDRVKLDCGGSRCGYSSDSCSDSEEEVYKISESKRNGVVVRGPLPQRRKL